MRKFTRVLQDGRAKTGVGGKGRCADNLFVERLQREVNSGDVFLSANLGAVEDRMELGDSFRSCGDPTPGPIRPWEQDPG